MISSLKVTNHLGESVTIDLRNPEQSGFLIRNITGISSPKADINITDLLVEDGGMFNSARAQKRNIVLTVVLLHTPTIEDARHNLYRFFSAKKLVTLEITSGNRTVLTKGYVESNEIDIFSERETAQISIICPQPYFESLSMQVTDVSFIQKSFEFPFSNESLTEKLLEFSFILQNKEALVYYLGNASVGCTITIHFMGTANGITIFETMSGSSIVIDTDIVEDIIGEPIAIGDDIVISTVKGNKRADIIHNGVSHNILSSLARNPDWIQLQEGMNVFGYTTVSGSENITVVVTNKILYEGV